MSWGVATQNGVSVSLASIVSLSCGATEFSPYDLFTSGVAGAWYDPSDINNYMAGLGPELVAPIDFNTGWTASGAAITVNSATSFTSAGVSNYYNAPFTVGRWYAVTINATFTGSSLNLYNGASAVNQITPTGLTSGVTQTFYFLALATQFNIRQSSAGTVTVNSIAVAELTGIANATLFQDSAGTTPVTAVEQPVGLMLDKSQGLVLGSELVTNGDFSSGTGWSTGGVWVISGGAASITSSITSLSQSTLAAVVGTWYQVTFTISAFTAGGVRVEFGGVNGASRTAAGTYTQYILATSTSFLVISPVATSTLSIDNVSIKSLAGNHASQATAASRPVLRARYNLLTYSEQFDNAAWTKSALTVTANATTAPDGTLTADEINEGTSTGFHQAYQLSVVPALTTFTASIYAKNIDGTFVIITCNSGPGNYVNAVFNLSTGVVAYSSAVGGGGATIVSTSITAANNGFYRCTMTGTVAASSAVSIMMSDSATTGSFGGVSYTGTSRRIYLWGADLRTGSSAGTYQRIAAATDYATAGFLPYLALSTDDSFGTNSIDFTATDKMSVCAGITKSSDAASAMLVELSANAVLNAGSFNIQAPVTGGNAEYRYGGGGTIFRSVLTSGYAAPITNVLAATQDIVGDAMDFRVNGVSVGTSALDQGTGNFGNYPLYIGRRGGASLPFNGNLYQIVICGKTLSASELASTEAYVATKTGVVI